MAPLFSRTLFFSFTFTLLYAAVVSAASLTGRVIDPDGRPVSNARVVVSGPLGIIATAQSDSSGGFLIDGLAAGRYDLRAVVEWHNSRGVELGGDAHLSRSERGFPGPYGSDPNHTFGGVDRIARGVNDRRQLGAQALHFWPGQTQQVRQRSQVSWGDFDGSFAGEVPSISESQRLSARTPLAVCSWRQAS